MLQIAICDDELLIIKALVEKVKNIIGNTIEYRCYYTTNSMELLDFSKLNKIDILLLDIEMPYMGGFDVTKELWNYAKNTIIIFITNMDNYVYESLKYHPFRFVRKSHIDELQEALKSAVHVFEELEQSFNFNINSESIITVKGNDIVYFESIHNNIRLVTIDGVTSFRETLKNLETQLNSKKFIRIHSAYIVNLKYVYLININSAEVRYRDKIETISISRSRHKDLVSAYQLLLR